MNDTHELLERLKTVEHLYGKTPLAKLDHEVFDLHAKLEFHNPTQSLKDRSAYYVLKSNIERGLIHKDTTVIESSSGNFAIATATLCNNLGLKFIPVIDPNISPLNLRILQLLCRDIMHITQVDSQGGYQQNRIAAVQQYIKEHKNAFWPNQYGNPDCMNAHYHLTAREITEQLPRVDYAFLPVSSGGTIAGCSRRLKEHFPDIKIIAVDAEGSVIFGGKAKKRYIPGIGSTTRPELLNYALIDEVIWVPETDAVEGCWNLLEKHGIFAGGSSGSCYAALNQLKLDPPSGSAKPVAIFLCPDKGTSYLDTIYSEAWCLEKINPTMPPRRRAGTL